MRIAHLILVHSSPLQTEMLIDLLAFENDKCFIHIDAKTEISDFKYLSEKKNVVFIKKRVKVYWGAFSIVEATLNGFKEIGEYANDFDYINLLSGQDYPVKKISEWHEYLQDNNGKAFMEYYSIENEWTEAIPRIKKYFLTNYTFKGSNLLERWMNKILPERKMPYGLTAVGRSQWFTITFEQMKFILNYLNSHPHVVLFFKYTWGCDEIFFQTILFNSLYKSNMVNDNLRYIDWSEKGVSPKVLVEEDFDGIILSGKFFARKFDAEKSKALINSLNKLINE